MEENKLGQGLFGLTEDYIEEGLSLDRKFMQNKESTFFIRASGDSMHPLITDQDILIVDRSLKVKHNDIIAIFYNGNPLCRKLVIKDNKKFLYPINKNTSVININSNDQVEIFGKVTGLARSFI